MAQAILGVALILILVYVLGQLLYIYRYLVFRALKVLLGGALLVGGFDLLGAAFGLSWFLPVNLVTTAVAGLGGIPGLGLLVALKMLVT